MRWVSSLFHSDLRASAWMLPENTRDSGGTEAERPWQPAVGGGKKLEERNGDGCK